MEREYLVTLFFCKKIKNHDVTLPYWFWIGKKDLNV
jgi:hypothetical protein